MNKDKIIAEVKTQGFSICENFIPQAVCENAIDSIDHIINSYPSAVALKSTDSRIFGAEHLSETIKKEFFDNAFVNDTLRQLYGVGSLTGRTLLAQQVEAIPGNLGSGGQWHRDSLPQQFKAFLYFTAVTVDSGPLQVYPGSHRFLNKFIAAGRRGRQWKRLDYDSPELVKNSVSKGVKEVSVTGGEGMLVFADTSIIHRGKPGLRTDRYSATYYAFKNEIPFHINDSVEVARMLAES